MCLYKPGRNVYNGNADIMFEYDAILFTLCSGCYVHNYNTGLPFQAREISQQMVATVTVLDMEFVQPSSTQRLRWVS